MPALVSSATRRRQFDEKSRAGRLLVAQKNTSRIVTEREGAGEFTRASFRAVDQAGHRGRAEATDRVAPVSEGGVALRGVGVRERLPSCGNRSVGRSRRDPAGILPFYKDSARRRSHACCGEFPSHAKEFHGYLDSGSFKVSQRWWGCARGHVQAHLLPLHEITPEGAEHE